MKEIYEGEKSAKPQKKKKRRRRKTLALEGSRNPTENWWCCGRQPLK